jgi:hypothetical protein
VIFHRFILKDVPAGDSGQPRSALFKVPFGKGATGSRLQIALEADGLGLVCEFDDDMKLPGTVAGGVRTTSGVVVREPDRHISGEADIEVYCLNGFEDVNESPIPTHVEDEGKLGAFIWHWKNLRPSLVVVKLNAVPA